MIGDPERTPKLMYVYKFWTVYHDFSKSENAKIIHSM